MTVYQKNRFLVSGLVYLAVLLSISALAASATTRLILLGGGTSDPTVLRKFVRWSGDKILVFRWASVDELPPAEGGIESELREAGARKVSTVLPAEQVLEDERLKQQVLEEIKQADGLFFSGGGQDRLMRYLSRDPRILRAIQDFAKSGKPIAGTSAGTAFMSRIMMYQDDDPKTGESVGPLIFDRGASLVTGTILDTHFDTKNREPRLEEAVKRHPGKLGLGIDEGAAVSLIANRYVLMLAGQAEVIELGPDGKPLKYKLSEGESFDLKGGMLTHLNRSGFARIGPHR